MSDENAADDGAIPAAPVENIEQENPATPAPAEGENEATKEQERARDEKGRFQSRVNELTRNWRQTERERDALLAQLQQFQSQQQTVPQGDEPPSIENFQNVNEWANAVAKHAAKQAQEQARKEFSERQQQTQQAQVFESYAAREREYSASNPEYADAYQALQSSVRFHPAILEVLAASDHGPAVVHHLGAHLDVADRISRLPPHLAAAELARIEAKVSAPRTKPVTKAPNPAPTLGGGATASKDPDRMTVDEWVRWRNSELKAR